MSWSVAATISSKHQRYTAHSSSLGTLEIMLFVRPTRRHGGPYSVNALKYKGQWNMDYRERRSHAKGQLAYSLCSNTQ